MMKPKPPHIPVMLNEILSLYEDRAIHSFLDGTVGAGGHSKEILLKHPECNSYYGNDQDPYALELATKNILSIESPSFKPHFLHGNFSELEEKIEGLKFDAILIDLGISSMQIDSEERGFSFKYDAPLDMRMDSTKELSAADLVNKLSVIELEEILLKYGEIWNAKAVAKVICEARRKEKITRTHQLIEVTKAVLPPKKKIHPATQLFQALRIATNDELGHLEEALTFLPKHLAPGGRFCVITFHSTEDRIVKQSFKSWSPKGSDYLLPFKKVIPVHYKEARQNPRSRSAKLRVLEKVSIGNLET